MSGPAPSNTEWTPITPGSSMTQSLYGQLAELSDAAVAAAASAAADAATASAAAINAATSASDAATAAASIGTAVSDAQTAADAASASAAAAASSASTASSAATAASGSASAAASSASAASGSASAAASSATAASGSASTASSAATAASASATAASGSASAASTSASAASASAAAAAASAASTIAIPTGGTTGQVLSKVDNTNYNMAWTTPSSGSTISGLTTGKLPKAASSSTIADSVLSESSGVISGATAIAIGTTPASAGTLRLPNAGSVQFRQQANGADYMGLYLHTDNRLYLGVGSGGSTGRVDQIFINSDWLWVSDRTYSLGSSSGGRPYRIFADEHHAATLISINRTSGLVNGAINFPSNSTLLSVRNNAGSGNVSVFSTDSGDKVLVGTWMNLQDNGLMRPYLQDVAEVVNAKGTGSGTQTFSFEDGNVGTLTANGATTIAFSNPPASGRLGRMRLFLTASGGTRAITWPGATTWGYFAAPDSIPSGETLIVDLYTLDGGTTYYATVLNRPNVLANAKAIKGLQGSTNYSLLSINSAADVVIGAAADGTSALIYCGGNSVYFTAAGVAPGSSSFAMDLGSVTNPWEGVYLRQPDGTIRRLTVNNSGALVIT